MRILILMLRKKQGIYREAAMRKYIIQEEEKRRMLHVFK
jgi:hypothetical protein